MNKQKLKLLAVLSMTLDHFALIILTPALLGGNRILEKLHLSVPVASVLNEIFLAIGSMAGTIMIYCVMEGFYYTKDRRRYLLRLLFFGVLSQIPFYLLGIMYLNMLFTLALCLRTLHVRHTIPGRFGRLMFYALLFAANLFTDWNLRAVPFTLILMEAFTMKSDGRGVDIDRKVLRNSWLRCMILYIIVEYVTVGDMIKALLGSSGMILGAILITYFYDGSCYGKEEKRQELEIFVPNRGNTILYRKDKGRLVEEPAYGKNCEETVFISNGESSGIDKVKLKRSILKYSFYLFYPLHLMVLIVIYRLLVA